MHPDHHKRLIFVQIASYRDPECHPTVTDLFEKAAHPERISVGICWQYDPEADAACFASSYPREEQVRVVQYHIKDAKGAGWARNQAQTLYQGEDYVLQIQAHMRFEKGWDDTLIELLHQCPGEKSVLTAWLPGYVPPNKKMRLKGELPMAIVNRLGGPQDAQMIHLIKRMVPQAELPDAPAPTCSWVGNFLFARASVLKEVPFDPHIYFWGEEINFSARLWTHGYDIYHLTQVVLYHYWDRENVKDGTMYRNHEDRRNQLSLMRNLHLFGILDATEAESIKDIDKYPLGTERSLDEYWRYVGVDLAARTIDPKARIGRWPVYGSRQATSILPRIFVEIASYRDRECQHTLNDMYAKAAYPDRVFVGVCLQNDPADKGCDVKPPRPHQARILRVHAKDSHGANWARATAHTLWQGEEYILQIDSHMRFEPGWDDMLIDMLSRCPSQKPVLCAYLPNYDPPDERDYHPAALLRIRIRKFGGQADPQLIHVTGTYVPKADPERGGLYPTPFYIANFMFTRAETLQEVPLDPHIFFYGDEISYAARLWTHGYDIFQPDKVVLFHYWVRKETLHLQHYRNTRAEASQRSLRRVCHLLGFEHTTDMQALAEIEKFGLGAKRPLDALWDFAGIDWQNHALAKEATEGHWNMTARKKALEGQEKQLPRIFVQIAAYRDPDCQYTVKDMFEKAAHPERVFAGIVWQFVKEEDAICFQVPYPRPKQVRVQEVDARQGKGVCWARSLTQKLWQGEEFTLQIDSHMRFEPGWDEILLGMWNDCENPRAVITSYPPSFEPPDKIERGWIFGMGAKNFDEDGIFLMKGCPAINIHDAPPKPVVGAFASACLLFGPSSIIKDVPYDPNLYFFGEEITMAVRLWTHGYDLYHPNKALIYHDWHRGKRKTHFDDHRDWSQYNQRSYRRVRHLLGTGHCDDPEIIKDLDKYGMGHARTLAQYQEYSGVNFANKTIAEHAMKGEFQLYKDSSSQKSFTVGRSKGRGEQIYVQIASYRDRECQWTVKDLFDQAADPDRLTVGVCWQFDEKEDQDCFQISTRPEQVKMVPVDWREGEGVCWARHMTQQLYDGEDYTLQIDAHMRFVPGWDKMMIDELAACESAKPVISCSPAAYTPPYNLQADPKPTIRRVQPFFPDGNIRGKGEFIDRMPEKPLNGAFIAAGFVFAKGDVIGEVPYDPYLYFDQEEITYAARLYTHGWDVFSARRPMLYHFYNDNHAATGTVRPLHWRDMKQADEGRMAFLRERGLSRFNHLMGHSYCGNPEFTREISTYGFGRVRTLKEYEDYTGIDFAKKKVSDKALRCLFIKDLEKYRDTPIYIPEIDGNRKPQDMPKQNGAAMKPRKQQAAQQAHVRTVPLEKGDFLPLLEIPDTNRKMRAIEGYGGHNCVLFFLSAHDEAFLTTFFATLEAKMNDMGYPDVRLAFILDDHVDKLAALREKLQIKHVLWADPDHRIAHGFGLSQRGQPYPPPAAYITTRNLQITDRVSESDPAKLAKAALKALQHELDSYKAANKKPAVVTSTAPVLIVQDVFTPEFCDRCIEAFRTGDTFDGTVGAEQKTAYRPNAKVRTDYIVHGDLLAEIDEKLSRSLFPEIKKIFGFDVKYREAYKIGLYSGDKGGFFKQHRDNFDIPMGYRRIAMTLHLSDDYEGGGLHFPEYDENIYRPRRGAAIAFSCSTMHEALPVTKGERFVIVGFFHSEEDEAFRRHYVAAKGQPPRIPEYTPVLRHYPGMRQSRDFVAEWRANNIHFGDKPMQQAVSIQATATQLQTQSQTTMGAPTMTTQANKAPAIITTLGGHKPKKVFESKQAIIFDDFLPEDTYRKVADFAVKTDYEYINTKGKVARAWHIHDGFPLRSALNLFYYAQGVEKPQGDYVYPTNTEFDMFADNILAIQPHVEQLTGKQGDGGWGHFSVTSWIYPHGTGLSMHDDGSGVYSGAYVYFINPTWRSHWGGLLIMVDEEGNKIVHEHRSKIDQMDFYKRKWLQMNGMEDLLMEHGFAKCIFPKGNRIVFIANDAYHMVTRVNEACGDNVRMSLAGFFNKKK